jgi:hypothetical protein
VAWSSLMKPVTLLSLGFVAAALSACATLIFDAPK